jgi:hypothetical protein
VAFAFHITDGDFNGTPLGDLNVVLTCYTPGPMSEGNWTSALYIDQRANSQQREALAQIMSGKVGGPVERWMSLTRDFRGTKYVPIEFQAEGRRRSVTIPGVMDFNVEGIMARGRKGVMRLVNTNHPVNRNLYLAKGSRSTYTDHAMHWENSGKNAHYAAFQWSWP